MAKSTSTAPRQQGSQAPQAERTANGPVFSCRHRALKAAVWKNETENGPMFNTTISRSYKDADDHWEESGSFGFDDLLIVAELLRTCYGFIAREIPRSTSDSKD